MVVRKRDSHFLAPLLSVPLQSMPALLPRHLHFPQLHRKWPRDWKVRSHLTPLLEECCFLLVVARRLDFPWQPFQGSSEAVSADVLAVDDR